MEQTAPAVTALTAAQLDALYHQLRADFPENLRLRLHRSLSWLKKADSLGEDYDLRYISYWISFNALYGREIRPASDDLPAEAVGSSRSGFKYFLSQICAADSSQLLYHALWQSFSQSIRVFLFNKFTSRNYWLYQQGSIDCKAMEELGQENQRLVQSALSHQNSTLLLWLLFDRLYTVRNQLVHGSSTYGGSVNRAQVMDGCRIMAEILPLLVQICLEKHDAFDLGDPPYPVMPD